MAGSKLAAKSIVVSAPDENELACLPQQHSTSESDRIGKEERQPLGIAGIRTLNRALCRETDLMKT